jgi:hypothetical protein
LLFVPDARQKQFNRHLDQTSACACAVDAQMFRILIDTCVSGPISPRTIGSGQLLGALEELIWHGEVSLIVPRVVIDEVARNKARIVEESNHSPTVR